MPLINQQALNNLARVAEVITSGILEDVAYQHRLRQNAIEVPDLTTGPIQARFESFSANDILADTQILATDLRMRVRFNLLPRDPTRFDTVVRPNGETWQVVNFRGGEGTPWWFCQVRQVA